MLTYTFHTNLLLLLTLCLKKKKGAFRKKMGYLRNYLVEQAIWSQKMRNAEKKDKWIPCLSIRER